MRCTSQGQITDTPVRQDCETENARSLRIAAHDIEMLRREEEEFDRLAQMVLEAKQIRERLDRKRESRLIADMQTQWRNEREPVRVGTSPRYSAFSLSI